MDGLPPLPVVNLSTLYGVALGPTQWVICKADYWRHPLVALGNHRNPVVILHQICDGSYVLLGYVNGETGNGTNRDRLD